MKTVRRLIRDFTPSHYQLSLTMDRSAREFEGISTVHGLSAKANSPIRLHSKDLAIDSVTVNGSSADYRAGENDELIITPADSVSTEFIIVVAYHGKITDAMHGLYPCYYDDEGTKKELLATQFESHHAREVFPCIDEPEAKATFDLTITTEQNITVLSNMPIKSQDTQNDLLVTSFETTPRMSTYLLAWVAGELHKKSAVTKSGVEVNIWATPAQKQKSLDFALDIAVRTIDFFDEYFGTKYPLPKSDHVALPDFSSGAMENWGLITYREIALLADPETTSISSKHYVATVIAHELSHQWFGNLVTMEWWNSLWLNESFATLMEYIAIDDLHPEWDIWLDFSTAESIMALRRDAIDGVQSVQVDVNHPDEISTLFDGAIVYAKGARLLRMLQQYIGHDAFQKGLRNYFQTHAYKNTVGDDLWKALTDASGKDVATFMNYWISESGYPVIHIDQQGSEVTLKQEQFFIGPHAVSQKIWPVPLNASCGDLPTLLNKPFMIVQRTDTSILQLNKGDSAHFITHYSEALLSEIIQSITRGELPALDRLQILNEQTLLARSGIISSATLIPLLAAYSQETTESVWDIISMTIGELKKFVEDDIESENKLRSLAAHIAKNQYERLGWKPVLGENESDTKMRPTIISLMLYGRDKEAISTALSLYNSQPIHSLDPETRALVISAAVRHGNDPAIIDTLREAYTSTSSAELQQDIASGITATEDAAQISKLLEMIKDEAIVRPQDVARWFIWIMRNRYGRKLAWQWLQRNWEWIEQTFAGDKSFDDYPRYAASALVTRQELQEYKNFFTPKLDIVALNRVITMGLSEIEGRVELIERDTDNVRSALI